ncbi:MAG: (d)CMP kinase [Kiritimatiellae bacterium]|nr:(d)CMP kinase [Kiritimatiellia bacterium]
MSYVIAIDGPSGVGKSSVARAVGERIGFLHVDSGALYRIMTWQCLLHQVDTSCPEAVAEFSKSVEVECVPEAGCISYRINGVSPGNAIRTPEINCAASPVATVKQVRERITSWLRSLTCFGNLIVEGRDITTAVFPDSPARFYFDASAAARAQRRQLEEIRKGIANQSMDQVKNSLLARDRIDSTRQHAPLRKAAGVYVIDTTQLTLAEVIEVVINALPPAWKKEQQ